MAEQSFTSMPTTFDQIQPTEVSLNHYKMMFPDLDDQDIEKAFAESYEHEPTSLDFGFGTAPTNMVNEPVMPDLRNQPASVEDDLLFPESSLGPYPPLQPAPDTHSQEPLPAEFGPIGEEENPFENFDLEAFYGQLLHQSRGYEILPVNDQGVFSDSIGDWYRPSYDHRQLPDSRYGSSIHLPGQQFAAAHIPGQTFTRPDEPQVSAVSAVDRPKKRKVVENVEQPTPKRTKIQEPGANRRSEFDMHKSVSTCKLLPTHGLRKC